MKKAVALILVPSFLMLTGCANALKTMVAHYNLSSDQVFRLARTNASINVCLSENLLDRGEAYRYSVLAAEMLELTVSDADLYANQYDTDIKTFFANKSDSGFAGFCSQVNEALPNLSNQLRTAYNQIASSLGAARAQENAQIAQMLSNNRPANNFNYQMAYPSVGYKPDVPSDYNVLINTSKGLTQCRVTKTNYVFCF